MATDADPGAVGAPTGAPPSGAPAAAAPAPRRPRPIFLLVGIVVAVALGVGLFTSFGSTSGPGRPAAGNPVPHFSLPALGGGATVAVTADGGGQGRAAILLFFASWCTPCQAEIPALAAVVRGQPASLGAKVSTLGIDGSDPTGPAQSFVRGAGVTFPVGADRTFEVTSGLFYFTGLPEAVAVRSDGTIMAIHYGALSTAQFLDWQRTLARRA